MDYSTLDLNKPLPDTFFDIDEYRAALRDILTAPREATKAWRQIQDHAAEIEELPDNPAEVNNTWLSEWYAERVKATAAMKGLTPQQRQQQIDLWVNLHGKIRPSVNTISWFFGKYNDIATYDPQTATISVAKDTADEMAKAAATHPTPALAFEHWQMMQKALAGIVQLRSWEEERDLKHIPLDRLLMRDADDFAKFWYAGNYYANGQKPLLDNYL